MDAFLNWLVKYKDALTIIGGTVAALTTGVFAIYKYRRESKRADNAPVMTPPEKKSSPAAPVVASSPEPSPARRQPTVSSQPPSGPNVLVLDCQNVNIIFGEEYEAREVSEGIAEAAVALLCNDPVKGRRVNAMVDTRALLTIRPDVGKPIHVAAGQWLDSSLNCVDFNPGDTNRLIIALRSRQVDRLGTLDDRRELNGPEDVRVVDLPPEMQTARVHVKLVGGFDSDLVEEFEFVLTREPFEIRLA